MNKKEALPGMLEFLAANQLSFPHQLRIKCAEYWLKLGEADEALRVLEGLPGGAWNHPHVIKARLAAIAVLRGKRS